MDKRVGQRGKVIYGRQSEAFLSQDDSGAWTNLRDATDSDAGESTSQSSFRYEWQKKLRSLDDEDFVSDEEISPKTSIKSTLLEDDIPSNNTPTSSNIPPPKESKTCADSDSA